MASVRTKRATERSETGEAPPERSAVASAFWTSVANGAIPLSALVTSPILARALGPTGRGELGAVVTPLMLAPLLITFGVPESVVFHIGGKRGSERTAVRAALSLGAASGLVACGLIILVAPFLLRHVHRYIGLLTLLALTLPVLMALDLGLQSVARGQRRFGLINWERWLYAIGRTVLIIALAAGGWITVTSAAWVQHGTAVLAAFVLVPIALWVRRAGIGQANRWRETANLMRSYMRYGIRSWPATIGGVIVLRLDWLLITPLSSARQLGLYTAAVSLAELPMIGLLATRDVSFATAVARRDPEFVARVSRTVVALTVAAAAAGILLAPFVIPLLFGSAFDDATIMARVLFLGLIPSGVSAVVLNAGLLGSGHPGLASAVQLCAAVVTAIALVLLVPLEGAIAAAWTTDAAYLMSAVLGTVALTRLTRLPMRSYLIPRLADLRELWSRLRSHLPRGAAARS